MLTQFSIMKWLQIGLYFGSIHANRRGLPVRPCTPTHKFVRGGLKKNKFEMLIG